MNLRDPCNGVGGPSSIFMPIGEGLLDARYIPQSEDKLSYTGPMVNEK